MHTIIEFTAFRGAVTYRNWLPLILASVASSRAAKDSVELKEVSLGTGYRGACPSEASRTSWSNFSDVGMGRTDRGVCLSSQGSF